jgi:recombination protein RecA
VKKSISIHDRVNRVSRDIRRDFGVESVIDFDTSSSNIEWMPCGLKDIDGAIGGGFPRGRIIEILGPEGSGKTALLLKLAAAEQQRGGVVGFIDVEHALSRKWARKIGFDVRNAIVAQPSNGEEAMNIARKMVQGKRVDLVIVDSVAALAPRAEIDGEDLGKQLPGAQARLMSKALRVMVAEVQQSRAVVAFVNQIRMKIGVMWGNPETTPGGNALKFYASVRIDVRRKDKIIRNKKLAGFHAHVKVIKNKVAPPFEECDFVMDFEKGLIDARKKKVKEEVADGE